MWTTRRAVMGLESRNILHMEKKSYPNMRGAIFRYPAVRIKLCDIRKNLYDIRKSGSKFEPHTAGVTSVVDIGVSLPVREVCCNGRL